MGTKAYLVLRVRSCYGGEVLFDLV